MKTRRSSSRRTRPSSSARTSSTCSTREAPSPSRSERSRSRGSGSSPAAPPTRTSRSAARRHADARMKATLLIEIGCEEIPARMIPGAASDLGARVASILDQAALPRGAVTPWGGTRRLAVRVDEVEARQPDRREQVLGPAASAAFGADGKPTPAGAGFARKQGIDPGALRRIDTEKGSYAGFDRDTKGKTVGEILAGALPASIAAMSFPKTMRWADGANRWVRPVHWVLALHGSESLPLEVFGVRAGAHSQGHRFLAPGSVLVMDPDAYARALRAAFVVADPEERRRDLRERLE